MLENIVYHLDPRNDLKPLEPVVPRGLFATATIHTIHSMLYMPKYFLRGGIIGAGIGTITGATIARLIGTPVEQGTTIGSAIGMFIGAGGDYIQYMMRSDILLDNVIKRELSYPDII